MKLYLNLKSNNINSFQLYKRYPQSDGFIRYFTKSKINQIQNDLKSIIEKEIEKEHQKNIELEKEKSHYDQLKKSIHAELIKNLIFDVISEIHNELNKNECMNDACNFGNVIVNNTHNCKQYT
jgi:hypothetical protein